MTGSLIAARVDLDGIFVGGHSWLRISLRLPRWYAVRVARKRGEIAGLAVQRGLLVQPVRFDAVEDSSPGGPPPRVRDE
jgi:hypothetical protein